MAIPRVRDVISILDKCRLCLGNGDINIFHIDRLSQDLFTYFFIKVSVSDNLPQKICSECLRIINDVKNLRDLASNNDTRLRSLFSKEMCEFYECVLGRSCNQNEETKILVNRIRLKDNNEQAVEYKCNVCRKVFPTKKKLYLHQRNHNKTYICSLDTCRKPFATKQDLEKHTRVHTGDRPYLCKLCNIGFTQMVTLRFHRERMHIHDPRPSNR